MMSSRPDRTVLLRRRMPTSSDPRPIRSSSHWRPMHTMPAVPFMRTMPTVPPHGSARLDAALASALVALDVIGVAADSANGVVNGPRVAGLVLVAAILGAGFLWRRTRPLSLLALVVLGYVVASAVDDRVLASQRTGTQVVIVVYAVASWSVHRRRGTVAALCLAGFAAIVAANGTGGATSVVSLPVALIGAPWFAGYSARARRRHLAVVEEQLVAAEADREQRARRAVAAERSRIARELHDVVAHHVSLIGVQAGAARTTLATDTDGARRALIGIEESSREVLREMRQLLEVLDSADGSVQLVAPPRAVEFAALCRGFSAAGLSVDGPPFDAVDALAPLVQLTIYRIIEEALTNVTRHSEATSCTVCVNIIDERVDVSVTNPGPSKPRDIVAELGAGRGLVGMRERVNVFGGTLECELTPGGGFRVHAEIPIPMSAT